VRPTPTARRPPTGLRDAHVEGRLTREEFDERIDRTFAAKSG
jgi:hypothetical protein